MIGFDLARAVAQDYLAKIKLKWNASTDAVKPAIFGDRFPNLVAAE